MVTVAFAVQQPLEETQASEDPAVRNFGDTRRPICESCALGFAKAGRYVFRIRHSEGKCAECGQSLTRPKAVAP